LRTAVLSDIHGNLEALDAVLQACEKAGAGRLVCLGDIVGYGGDPGPCLEKVRAAAGLVVAGNHDRAAAGLEALDGMSDTAADAIAWTAGRLTADERTYLGSLDLTAREGEILYVHGSPEAPEAFHYIFSAADSEQALAFTDARITFVGHSHRMFVFEEARSGLVQREGSVVLRRDARYLVNAGSVGQPRDGDSRSAFVLWDSAEQRVSLVRVPYDVQAAQARILKQGLPPMLAYRLSTGR
jgi:diadenosine tetraphosphatase ApaH/serine/threonine PP2A family protein phosphatase